MDNGYNVVAAILVGIIVRAWWAYDHDPARMARKATERAERAAPGYRAPRPSDGRPLWPAESAGGHSVTRRPSGAARLGALWGRWRAR